MVDGNEGVDGSQPLQGYQRPLTIKASSVSTRTGLVLERTYGL